MLDQSKFWKELHTQLIPFLELPFAEKHRKRFRQNLFNSLMGIEDTSEEYMKLNPLADFLRDILHNYHEIKYSRERLKVSGLLIRQYPSLPSWRTIELTKTTYLRYHYESFLQEIHLYRERIVFFLADIKKKCISKKLHHLTTPIQEIRKNFLDSLESATKIRNWHVHNRRYKNNKIEHIESLELFSEFRLLQELKEIEYRKLRTQLSKEIFEFYSQLQKLENVVLDPLIPIIFTDLKSKYT